jgi:Mrp family chromosome partitioning ATPase
MANPPTGARGMRLRPKETDRNVDALSGLFLNVYPSKSRFAEAYRTLRTNIRFSFLEHEFRSLLVTSSGMEEGKTITTMNLSYTIAQSGRGVVMVDADLRKPFLSRLMPSREMAGLTGVLSDILGAGVRTGTMAPLLLQDLVRLLGLQKKTGVLGLEGEGQVFEFLFFQGRLMDCRWPTCPPGKQLLSLLVKRGILTEAAARAAAEKAPESGTRPGFDLINSAGLDKEALAGPLNMISAECIQLAMRMESGRYIFQERLEADMERNWYDPEEVRRIYREVAAGEDASPHLKAKILSAVQKTGVEGLSLLPAGPLPPNPSELLGSERMLSLLSILKSCFDVVVVDTPPILPASDALVLAPHTDGVVFVVKAGKLNREMVRKAVDQLRKTNAKILGAVLNQVDDQRGGYYKYYEKYYSKYYGEEA